MEQADWTSRWEEGQIGFHQPTVADFLTKYSSEVWGADGIGRIYVPLCGKSLDMVFLRELATEVVGVEFVEQAVAEFFAERALVPTVATAPFVHYTADGFRLFAADFFALEEESLGSVDAVFDRAALVALDQETRTRYAKHLRSLLRIGTKILLITFDYDQTEMSGPPFAVSGDEVHRLFDEGFAVKHLETRDSLNDVFRGRGLSSMTESAYELTRT